MKTGHRIFLTLSMILLTLPAFSIEANEKIKATPILKTQTTWIGQDIIYPEGKAEVTGQIIEMAPGAETGWHSHPVPSFGVVLEGELEVKFKNGEVKHLKAGESSAESINMLHNGKNVGKIPLKLVVFYAGTTSNKTTLKEVP